MRITKKYLKQLLDIYEIQLKEVRETIKSYKNQMEVSNQSILAQELQGLYLHEANLQGRMSLCRWLINM